MVHPLWPLWSYAVAAVCFVIGCVLVRLVLMWSDGLPPRAEDELPKIQAAALAALFESTPSAGQSTGCVGLMGSPANIDETLARLRARGVTSTLCDPETPPTHPRIRLWAVDWYNRSYVRVPFMTTRRGVVTLRRQQRGYTLHELAYFD
jgi:hypothetical protein